MGTPFPCFIIITPLYRWNLIMPDWFIMVGFHHHHLSCTHSYHISQLANYPNCFSRAILRDNYYSQFECLYWNFNNQTNCWMDELCGIGNYLLITKPFRCKSKKNHFLTTTIPADSRNPDHSSCSFPAAHFIPNIPV